jgi:hypothetical protein
MRRIAAKWMLVLMVSGVGLWASEEEARACETCTTANQGCWIYAENWCWWNMGRNVWWADATCEYDENGCVVSWSCDFECTPNP